MKFNKKGIRVLLNLCLNGAQVRVERAKSEVVVLIFFDEGIKIEFIVRDRRSRVGGAVGWEELLELVFALLDLLGN